MSPEAAIVLAERILALGEGVVFLVERALEAAEQGKADRAAYYMRQAALGQASGASAHAAATKAGKQ